MTDYERVKDMLERLDLEYEEEPSGDLNIQTDMPGFWVYFRFDKSGTFTFLGTYEE